MSFISLWFSLVFKIAGSMPRNSCKVVSPNSSICREKNRSRMWAYLLQITIFFHDTVHIFWGWVLRLSSHRVPVYVSKAFLERLEHRSKICVIQTSMNVDPCRCRVKSLSTVATMPFWWFFRFSLHLNCPSIFPFERSQDIFNIIYFFARSCQKGLSRSRT